MGIIRAATGIKEINVITATSAGEVVLLLLLFIIQKIKGFLSWNSFLQEELRRAKHLSDKAWVRAGRAALQVVRK